jgi:hypothetical protein
MIGLSWLAGCNSSGPINDDGDGTGTVTQTENPQETGSGEDTQSVTEDTQSVTEDTQSVTEDTESVTEDTHSVTEDTESVTEDTGRTTGSVFGAVSLLGSGTAEGVSVKLLDHGLAQVAAAETEASGEYEFLDVAPGSYTVRASRPGYVNDERRVEVAAGVDLEIDFTLQVEASQGGYRLEYVAGGSNGGDPDQRGTVGRALSEALTVRLVSGAGQPVSFAEMRFEVVDAHNGGAVDSADIATGPDGEAANGYVLGTLAGENHVRVWSPAGGSSIHYYPEGQPDEATSLTVVSGANQTGQVGASLSLPVRVLAKDQYANAVPGTAISFSAGSGGAATPQTVATDASGLAQTSWTLGSKLQVEPPQQELVASASKAQVTVQATNISKTPVRIVIVSGDGQSSRSGESLPSAFVVKAEDDWGNPGYGHTVTWTTSTGGSVSPGATSIGQDGLAQARGTMGVLLSQVFFATLTGGEYVTFHADKVGDTKVSLTEPMLVWPGYPDASVENPEELEVPLTIRGTGFGPEAKVVWNVGSPEEEELLPTSVTATEIVVQVTADHFEEVGTYPIAVRNLETDAMQSFGFKVAHTLLAPSAQDSSQCTKSLLSGWEWTECSEIGPEDTAYGQDGHYEEKAEGRWDASDNGTVYDHITGLSWMRCMAGQTYNATANSCDGVSALPGNYAKAQALCEEMNRGGVDHWRVPTIYELLTLRHESYYGYDTELFPETSAESWTSTFVSHRDYYTGYLYLRLSDLVFYIVGDPLPVRCVRGQSIEREKYVADMSAGVRIVKDSSTGLMWNACPIGTSSSNCSGTMTEYTWSEALGACSALVDGGYGDWRLANSRELMTLFNIEALQMSPSLFGTKTGENRDWSFWSSTTDRTYGQASRAIVVSAFGSMFTDNKDAPNYSTKAGALCVRMGY